MMKFSPTKPLPHREVTDIKKNISTICIFILIFSMISPASATERQNTFLYTEYSLEDGIVVIDEVIEHPQSRSNSKEYTRRKTLVKDDVVIAIISIHGSFQYDGSSVTVVSKSVTQTDTYDGWSYKQNSFTSSGGTITLSAKLTRLLVLNIPFTMTLSCDKDGNISYT